jgi:protein gp37
VSKIEWTEKTWNPITGCKKISDGCTNCFAERMSKRLQAMGLEKYKNGFEVAWHPKVLYEPYKTRGRKRIFVCSMSDLFHDGVPRKFVERIFLVIQCSPQHTFQVLTKRPERFADYKEFFNINNLIVGVTVENENYINRINYLPAYNTNCKTFISFEPLLGPIPNIDLTGIDWVIVGGESGPGARPIKPEWVRQIRDMCIEQKVKFFFKQWGGVNKKKNGRILDGKIWNEMPTKQISTQRTQ